MSKRITLHGAGDDEIAQLRDALQRSAGGLHSKWTYHAGNETDLLVIDVDTVYGHMDWLRAHSSGKPVAVLTEHTQFNESDLVLYKPFNPENVADVLNRAGESIEDRPEAFEPPTPPPAPEPPRQRTAVTAARAAAAAATLAANTAQAAAAQAAVTQAAAPAPIPAAPEPPRERRLADWLADGALRAAVRLQEADAPQLVIDPHSKTYHVEGNLRALAPYCARAIMPSEWHEVAPAEMAKLQETGKMQPLSRLLWLAHALGSNGQISAGLDINAKFKLARWPQIEREFAKHFRIATVMLKQPATLAEIAEQSGASLTDVIDFTNAYNATGYIETDGGAKAADSAPRDSGRHAILSRLRNPFGGG